MADNTARARRELDGMRKAISAHVDKYKRYPNQQDKDTALKTVVRVQGDVERLKGKHPTLRQDSSWEDRWRP